VEPNDELLSCIKRQGFAVVPNVADAGEVSNMREALAIAIDEDLKQWSDNPYYKDHWMVHNLMLRGAAFVRLLENETIHAYLSALLSPHCVLYAYTSSSMPPKGGNYSGRVHVDARDPVPGYWRNVGVLLALDDFTEESGATYFLPRSFERADAPSEEEFFAGAVRVFPKSGDAIIFNAGTWHHGGRNNTEKARHAVTMNVCRFDARQRFDYPRMVTENILRQIGPVGKRFLGFDVRTPSSLEEYYVAPEDRVFKPGQY